MGMTAAVHPTLPLPRSAEDAPAVGLGTWCLQVIWYATVLMLVVGAGIMNLYRPLHGDTALFLLGADAMSRGDVLYVDFWDNKQPGIYAFYFVAGRLFGFTGFGVHVLELCWMLAFAAVLCAALRPYLHWRWLSGVAPLVLFSIYYFRSDSQMLMQVEALVGFPIFVCSWLLARDWTTVRGRIGGYALAGVAAAVAVTFKLVLAPLFVLLLLASTVGQLMRRRPTATIPFVAGLWAAFTCGVVAVLGAVVLAFAAKGALSELLWTSFVYPDLALREIARGLLKGAPVTRLSEACFWLLAAFAPWLPLAALGVARCFRRGEPALMRLMLVWLVGGIGVIILQRFSWWTYHMPLLFVPLSVLTVRGLNVLITALSRLGLSARRATLATIAFLIFPPLAAVGVSVSDHFPKVKRIFAGEDSKPERIARYQRNEDEMYRRLAPVAEAIRGPQSLPGDIYVIGDPLIYLFTGRHQAIPVHGWSWEVNIEPLWQRLPGDILNRRPVYIFIDPELQALIVRRHPEVLDTIAIHYTAVWSSPEGVWYQLNQPAS